jgi:dihydroorotate dehydrogenase electron transfer subunit
MACSAKPGQFVTVRCGDFTLRRPLSIHCVGSSQIALLFRVAGRGTLWLSQRRPGERLDVIGPLGNGFGIPPAERGQPKRLLLVAGGMGIAPLVLLTQHAVAQHRVTLVHGAATAAQIYPWAGTSTTTSSTGKRPEGLPPLPDEVQFVAVTEDGSAGQTGLITDILPQFLDHADLIYACGPLSMYRVLADMTCRSERSEGSHDSSARLEREHRLRRCQVSLEVRLGCGFGACYGCTIKTKQGLKRVCHDGPVFELDDIIWQEVQL